MYRLTMSQMDLANLLFARQEAYLLPDGQSGYFQGLLKESGCGTSFILSFRVGRQMVTVICKIK